VGWQRLDGRAGSGRISTELQLPVEVAAKAEWPREMRVTGGLLSVAVLARATLACEAAAG